ncbi:MAG TPA: hypothetical protein VNG71_10440 [Pyrinomonadaceae bacterium]|nr:hypothetical protein [Pyrinomonadaceae bacterium]
MAQLLIHAQPGDVITADDWNLVVDAINELLQSSLATGIHIAATLPAGTMNEPFRIGTLIQITGTGFGFSIGQTKVTFYLQAVGGNTPVEVLRSDMLAGSSDTRLLFMMPALPNHPGDAWPTTMTISNGVGEDRRNVYTMPVVIDLTGDMFVNWRGDTSPNPNPNPIQASQAASYAYRLNTGTNVPAIFTLAADIQNASVAVPPGLVDSIEFRDEVNAIISNKTVHMGTNETRNIIVRIPQIPPSFASQSFTLRLTASSGAVVGTDARPFTVGVAVTPTDPDIDANQTGFNVIDVNSGTTDTNTQNGRIEGNTVKLKAAKRGIVTFNVVLKKGGTYDITIAPKQGTTLNNWDPRITNDTPGTRVDNTRVTVTVAGDGDQTLRIARFQVQPTAAATATGTVVFRIKRQGAAGDWFKEYGVELLP